jgi:ComF family protein
MSTSFISKVNLWLKNIQYCVLPGTCINCHKASERNYDLCASCENLLPRIKDPCISCGLPLPANNYDGFLCGNCIISPPPYKHIISAFNYAEPIDHLIGAFKYQGKLAYGKVLSKQLLQLVMSVYSSRTLPELLIPMPLHTSRLQHRGFNQSIEISRYLSRHLNIPQNINLCFRNRFTLQQEGLTASARKKNLRGAFSIRQNFQSLPKSFAIIDDVVTTTASTQELAFLLLSHGVKDIHIWSLARACRKI